MKKIYHLFFLLNIIYGIFVFINILFLSQYNNFSIPIMIGITIFYIMMIILYFKKNSEVETNDIITLSIFALFLIGSIIFIIYYQSINARTYNMLYFSKLLILPSIIYSLYNVFGRD